MSTARPFSLATVPNAPLYIVQRDFGAPGFESVTQPEMTREGIVADIVSGEIDRAAYVIEVYPLEGISRDITSDIVDEVERRLAMKIAAE